VRSQIADLFEDFEILALVRASKLLIHKDQHIGTWDAPERPMTPKELQARTKRFAVDVIRFSRELPTTLDGRTTGGQLLRAATSVAANYRSACRGRSRAEFIAKLGIVLEEADESLLWLEVINEAEVASGPKVEKLLKEADELTAIFTTSMKTAKG
jgi:four helix bundle protein